MADAPSPTLDDQLWTIAAARLIFGPAMNIQAPPNLSRRALSATDRRRHQRLGRRVAGDARSRQSRGAVAAARRARARRTGAAGKMLVERLPVYPAYAQRPARWLDAGAAHARCCERSDARRAGRATTTGRPARPPAAAARDAVRCRHERRSRDRSRDHRPRARPASAVRKPRSCGCSRRAAPTIARGLRAPPTNCARRSAATRVTLRRQPQHQLHQHLLLPLQVLRLLQGQDARDAARHAVRPRLEEIVRRVARGVGSRRHRSVPAGRHPSRLHRRDLSRHLPRDQGAVPGMHVHAFSPLEVCAGRGDARASPSASFWRAEGGRARHAAGHGGRNPRRRGARRHLPGQGRHRAMAGGDARRRTRSGCARRRPSCTAMSSIR